MGSISVTLSVCIDVNYKIKKNKECLLTSGDHTFVGVDDEINVAVGLCRVFAYVNVWC